MEDENRESGIEPIEFQKRTIAVLAELHQRGGRGVTREQSLSAVLSGYNIALDEVDPLFDELLYMMYGLSL